MNKHDGYTNWDVCELAGRGVQSASARLFSVPFSSFQVNIHTNHYREVFDCDKVVYLTSESENVVEKLEDDMIYVIGGLVDHNHSKV